MHCGTATPTDPGVPPRTAVTGAFEVAQVTQALAGRYKVERVLGEGGMATVYLAEDQKHRRKVAVKVMRPELAATLGSERFLREVQIAAQLSHPHILPMHDSGEAGGLLYYVMPYVEGETLKERLARDGSLPPDEALRLAREIAEALAYAHKRGIIHRDIKPANILLGEGHALVADFGIARAVDEGGGEALTKTGLAIGTPQYMAPEQAAGEKDVDGRADVYATGAILYEMLAGEPPFTGSNPRAILTKSLTEKPRALPLVKPTLTPAVDTVVQKAMAKQAEERFASATEFMQAIDAVRSTTSGSMPALSSSQATQVVVPPEVTTKRGLARWLTPVNVGVAAVAVIALVFALRGAVSGDGGHEPSGKHGNRVVVLPFTTQGAAGDEYIAEGISDEVRGKLARLAGLSVIASTSANQFQSSGKTPQAFARELGADYVLVGKVRASGEGGTRRLQVVPELIDVHTGDVKWQQPFDAALSDVFAVQSDIATQVTAALGVALAGDEQRQLAQRPTGNLTAYQAYLRALRIVGGDAPTLRRRIGELEQAVALDSTFADAWAALSTASALLFSNGNRDPQHARRAREALDRLRALDSTGATYHVTRSRYASLIEGDNDAARREIDLALRVAPNDVTVLARAGGNDQTEGNFGSALTRLERARELDPRSSGTLSSLVDLYVWMGRPQDAVATGKLLLEVVPMEVTPIQTVAMAHLATGNLPEARRVLQQALERGVPATALAAQMTGVNEVGWALDEETQRLALRLTPTAFDGDRAWWAQSLATLHWQRGDTALARAYADSALGPTREQLAGSSVSQLRGLLGLMLAYQGRAQEARAEVATAIASRDAYNLQTYNLLNGAKIETALGNRDSAVVLLRQVRARGSHETPGWLRIDPTFASLKGHPGFEQLLQDK